MAIAKVRKKAKFEATPTAYLQFGIAITMVLASLVLGWQAFAKWQFKRNLLEGYATYDSNRQALAKPALVSALGWNDQHAGARELLAKIRIEEGSYNEAEQELQKLISQGYDRPQVHVSLGVILLKKAAKAANAAEATTLVTQAQAEFGKAGSIPEAAIGRGHAELLLAWKLSDSARYVPAHAIFEKLRTDFGNKAYREQCTREGLVDYYSGLGKVLAMKGKYDAGASAAFRSCYQYAPSWLLPMTNVLRVEAQRFSESNFSHTQLLEMKSDTDAFRRATEQQWKTDPRFKELKEPWMQYALSVAFAYLRAGSINEYEVLVSGITSALGDEYLEPYVLDAYARVSLVFAPDSKGAVREARIYQGMHACNILVSKTAINEEANKELKSRALCVLSFLEATRGVTTGLAQVQADAVTHAEAAAKLFPKNYTYNRNVVLAMRFAQRPPAAWKPYLDAAKASDKEPGDEEDFVKLMSLVSGSP
jgi:hypothetical protein